MHFATCFQAAALCNFRTCGLKTQVFRTRVQDVETRVPRQLSLHALVQLHVWTLQDSGFGAYGFSRGEPGVQEGLFRSSCVSSSWHAG